MCSAMTVCTNLRAIRLMWDISYITDPATTAASHGSHWNHWVYSTDSCSNCVDDYHAVHTLLKIISYSSVAFIAWLLRHPRCCPLCVSYTSDAPPEIDSKGKTAPNKALAQKPISEAGNEPQSWVQVTQRGNWGAEIGGHSWVLGEAISQPKSRDKGTGRHGEMRRWLHGACPFHLTRDCQGDLDLVIPRDQFQIGDVGCAIPCGA